MSKPENLSAERKRELVAELLRKKKARSQASQQQAIAPRDPGKDPPLSFAQQRLWFLEQLEPDAAAYAIPTACRLIGPLDKGAMQAAVDDLVHRHEPLRTVFESRGGTAVQRVLTEMPVQLQQIDARGIGEAGVRKCLDELMHTPFDLAAGPLLSVSLLEKSAEEHVLAIVMHHIISDGWSLGILFRDLAESYLARVQARGAQLPALSIQYADYATWQHNALTGDELGRQLDYWVNQLEGIPSVLELPTDFPRPRIQTFNGNSLVQQLSTAQLTAIKSLAQEQGCTLFMALLAAFAVLLTRWTGQTDVVVGTPVAGRQQRELEQLIGFFINTLVMRVSTEGNPSFVELLAQVKQTTLDAYAHQDLPFEKLVERLNPVRDPSHPPIIQVVFGLHNEPLEGMTLTGLDVRPQPFAADVAKFDLVVQALEGSGGLMLRYQYNVDLFDKRTIERFADQYASLCDSIIAQPDAAVRQLNLLSPAEAEALQSGCGAAVTTDQPTCTVVTRVLDHFQQRSDALAVCAPDAKLTYGELDRRSRALAGELLARGVSAGSRVCTCMNGSAQLIVGWLAILRAGAVYVPMDPANPPDRLGFMIEDAGAELILVTPEQADLVGAAGVPLLTTDGWPAGASEVELPEPARDDLAYVIFTSGSTGKPKGVAVEHAALMNLVQWHQRVYAVSPDDRATQLAGVGFDACVWELWPYLSAGAAVYVPDQETRADIQRLWAWYAEMGITLSFMPTPMAEVALKLPLPPGLALRQLLTGGDRLHDGRYDQLPFGLVNHYGPTENAVVSTAGEVVAEPAGRAPPIGRPIDNVCAFVLDEYHELAPVGVVGELYVGGASLARGYHDRPTLTDERFVMAPEATGYAGRLYRTGDQVRWLADGRIEFIGRADFQVKIRGFRIELGEVESVIQQQDGVSEAVCVALEDSSADKRLVAYVVGDCDEGDLLTSLRAELPDYMLPDVVVQLAELPMTPNGKVDRKALPEPERKVLAEYVAPESREEVALAKLYASLLDVERVGVNDDFFGLGGHSLLATQLASRIRDELGVEMPLRQLFDTPRVGELAAALTEAEAAANRLPEIKTVSRDDALPLSFAQQRLWFLDELEPGLPVYNVPLALRLDGPLELRSLELAFDALAARHESLRTSFAAPSGKPVQVIAHDLSIPCEVDDGEGFSQPQIDLWIREQVTAPFSLRNGPLLRVRLLKLAAETHVLVLVIHHIVADGWSMGVLFSDLSALYEASMGAQAPQLPDLPVQYADYAAWQRRWLSGAELDRQLSFWREQLSDAPPVLELPTDRPRPQHQGHAGAKLARRFSVEVSGQLRQLAEQTDSTLFMVMLTAFAEVLARWSGQRDVVVGTPIAGRRYSALEGLIGFFVNTLALRLHWQADASFSDLLKDCRAMTLGAYAHQDLPFEKLVEELQPTRDTSHSPIFQVLFGLHNELSYEFPLPGLEVQPMGIQVDTAKFDLNVSISDFDGGLLATFEYSTDLFDAATVERLAGHYERLLEAVVQDPHSALAALPLLADGEQQRLLSEFSGCGSELRELVPVHQLFEAQADAHGDRQAVEFDGQQLTYGELDARANRLAAALIAEGAGADDFVAICMERSISMVVSVLAVLKAGSAYIPVDPEYPAERISYMLQDSGARILLVGEESRLDSEAGNAKVLCVDDHATDGEHVPAPAVDISPQHAAYAIYTSGSTGQPKGVVLEHGGLANLILWQVNQKRFSSPARTLQFASLSFDVSFQEMFSTWASGGTLVLIDEARRRDPAALAAYLTEQHVERLYLPFAALQPLAESLAAEESLPPLRDIVVAGEQLQVTPAVRSMFLRLDDACLHNHYGPSETHVVTACVLDGPATAWPALPPIGTPVDGVTAYVVDDQGQHCPIGVPGELLIGGVQVARGYHARAQLTAEKFIGDPIRADSGLRFYRTGDRARFLADGQLEFLGRIDQQVKWRGYRIEPGELEALLSEHAAVAQAAVVLRDDIPGDPRLVAYVAAAEGQQLDPAELKAYLRERVPDYMVPAAVNVLETMPLTPSGKLSRRELPAPVWERDAGEEYVAPSTPLEEQLAGIFSEVLAVERVGVNDNFFSMGGHSLLATQVVARIRENLQVELPLRSIFSAPTVSGLAALIEETAGRQQRAQELLANIDELSDEEVERLLSEMGSGKADR